MAEENINERDYSLLRDKVKSKMEVAKFFVGIVSVVFGLLIEKALFGEGVSETGQVIQVVSNTYLIALFLLVISIVFSGGAIFAYDSLLLPPSKLKSYCNDDPVNEFLHRRMILSWRLWFVPSVISYVLAMILLLAPITIDRIRPFFTLA